MLDAVLAKKFLYIFDIVISKYNITIPAYGRRSSSRLIQERRLDGT